MKNQDGIVMLDLDQVDKLNNETAADPANKYLIFQTDTRKQIWDFLIVMILMESSIYIPLKVVFFNYTSPFMWFFDCLIDFLFLFDVLINFNTAVFNENGLFEIDKKQIARNYFHSWFALDLFTSFPL